MENITESIRQIVGNQQINLYFLTNENSDEKTLRADATRAGFANNIMHFTTENTKSHDLAGKQYMCSDEILLKMMLMQLILITLAV